MSYQCIKCGRSYPDSSKEVLQGCFCGGKAFYFIKDLSLNNDIKDDVKTAIDFNNRDIDETRIEGPINSIESKNNISEDGYTLIDVDALLHEKEVIFSPEEGKYAVNIEAILSGKRPKL